MDKEQELYEAILEVAAEEAGLTMLPCAKAFELSDRFGVALMEIRTACDEHDIKITACQLGCFG